MDCFAPADNDGFSAAYLIGGWIFGKGVQQRKQIRPALDLVWDDQALLMPYDVRFEM
jgi:hypothetical protein